MPSSPSYSPKLSAHELRPPDISDISGGSFPGAAIRNVLQIPILSVPYGNADENNHAPNENLAIDCFTKGIRTSAALFFQLAGNK